MRGSARLSHRADPRRDTRAVRCRVRGRAPDRIGRGIFSFGDAQFRGSTSSTDLAHPIAGVARTGDGHGYWLVESDGATVHAFGNARTG